jgi:hypothetical protein
MRKGRAMPLSLLKTMININYLDATQLPKLINRRRSSESRNIGSRRSPRFMTWYTAPGYSTLSSRAIRPILSVSVYLFYLLIPRTDPLSSPLQAFQESHRIGNRAKLDDFRIMVEADGGAGFQRFGPESFRGNVGLDLAG